MVTTFTRNIMITLTQYAFVYCTIVISQYSRPTLAHKHFTELISYNPKTCIKCVVPHLMELLSDNLAGIDN